MPLFEKPDWFAYKCALSRIAETGSKLEEAEAEGALDLQAAAQQFQEALDAYQAARTGLVGVSPRQMSGEIDGQCAPGAPADGTVPLRGRPDRSDREGPWQQG